MKDISNLIANYILNVEIFKNLQLSLIAMIFDEENAINILRGGDICMGN